MITITRRQAKQLALPVDVDNASTKVEHVSTPTRRRADREHSDRTSTLARCASAGWVVLTGHADGSYVYRHTSGLEVRGATYSQCLDAALQCDEKSHTGR